MRILNLLIATLICVQVSAQDLFPDGTSVPEWFRQTEIPTLKSLGKLYRITEHGVVNDSTIIQTKAIQAVIDKASQNGGGVVYVPKGVFHTGALFFKPNTHLYVEKEGVIKGSDNIVDYPALPSRMEGQNLKYFAALINAYDVNGFTITGGGTINGNGLRFWQSFWQRRAVEPKCTNLEVSRPRLVFIWNSNDVLIADVRLINSGFWTTHLYKCDNVKMLNLHIFAPEKPLKAPSSDAIDIDVCKNVLIKNCYMSVNDDAVVLKGGKGPWADKDPNNGGNENIIIEDCVYGFCHGALTFGSESVYDKNIILRRCTIKDANRVLWLKMRPDTPQKYEYILVEDIKGENIGNFVYIKPWTQFYDLKDRKDIPLSYSNNVILRNINVNCNTFFNVDKSDQYILSDFTFEDINVTAKNGNINKDLVNGFELKNVKINDKEVK